MSAGTTAPTGLALDLRRARHARHGVLAWPTRSGALAELARQRAAGVNLARTIEAHPARTHLAAFWVLGRPDHHVGVTYLMTAAGGWLAGRLTDAPCFCADRCRCVGAPWSRLAADAVPAVAEHVIRTVADTANRHERYRTKSNGSAGRWVTTDDAVALCTCGRRFHGSTRAEARARGNYHRDHPLDVAPA